MTSNEAPPTDVIEEAIMVFDAGNHAWGRYRHFVLPALAEAPAISTDGVREALADAAISVIDAQAGRVADLLEGLRRTAEELRRYREALPDDVQRAEIDEAAGDFDEAIALLSGGTEERA